MYFLLSNNDKNNFKIQSFLKCQQIAGCKRPVHVDCRSLAFHFHPLPAHFRLRCPIIQLFKKKIEFRKIYGHTKKVTSKDPFREYARDLKISKIS